MNKEIIKHQKLGADIFVKNHVQLIIDDGKGTIDYDLSKPLKLYLSYKKGNSEKFWITAAVDEIHLYAQYLNEFAIKETFTEFTEAYVFGSIENVQGYTVNLVQNTSNQDDTTYRCSEGYDIIK